MRGLHYLSNALFPPKCILCGRILERDELDLCRMCRVDGPDFPAGKLKIQFVDSFAAVWYYEGNVRRSLLRYKFHRARHLAPGYGRRLAMKLTQEMPEGFDLITWVPISALRKLSRGFDQDALLAGCVARELGQRAVPTLKKVRNNPRQSGIHGEARRRANVLGAYRCIDAEAVRGKRILLVDDILTSGATAGECARVLRTAGAGEVHCAVVAAARHK